jgi:hypothetical protein
MLAPQPGPLRVPRSWSTDDRLRVDLEVRLRDEEFEELAAYAEQRGLPVSTAVRTLVRPGDRTG